MKDFQSYSPENAIEENLRETALRMNMIAEQELAHLREFAAEITSDSSEHPDWIASLPDNSPPQFASASSPLNQNVEAVSQMGQLRNLWQRLRLCKEIRKNLEEKNLLSYAFFFPEIEEAPPKELCRVAYQRNSYADSAYWQFSKILQDPRVSYAHSFIAACEDVYNGICEYCILPVESSAEGQLNSFSRLIERFDLKIAATCEVSGTDASKVTRFALLSRDLSVMLQKGKQTFFEFAAPVGGSPSTAALLSVAELCGLELYRVDSLPASAPHRFSSHCLFLADQGDLYTYLIYLAMEAPHYDPIGIYSQI